MESTACRMSWNVFLPDQILCEPSCYLTGTVYHHMNIICVHGIVTKKNPKLHAHSIVGYWQLAENEKPTLFEDPKQLINIRFIVKKLAQQNKVCCRLEMKLPSGCLTVHPVTCIIFNSHELEASHILLHCTKNKHNEGKNDYHSDKLGCSENPVCVLARHLEEQQIKPHTDSGVKSLYKSSRHMPRALTKPLQAVPFFLTLIVSCIGYFVSVGMGFFRACIIQLPKFMQKGSFIDHLEERASCYRRVLSLDRRDKFNMYLLYNCYGHQFMDTCLGLFLILLFVYFEMANQISSYILDWADDIAQELITLILWLMGSPAGLKLNSQLTKFFGHFFIYHIHLWTGYLSVLRNMLPCVIRACSFTGVLGGTFQMCLVIDILSMLTLHIYCFYVYAARAYNTAGLMFTWEILFRGSSCIFCDVYVTKSLWRLFRGKKCNVLRSRVDSASYDRKQLLLGTLLFVIILSLMPTTALYYAVFTLLRLLVLMVQGLLSKVVTLVKSTPIFTLALRVISPKLVAGNVMFTVPYLSEDENCLILHMKTTQIPINRLLKLTAPVLSPRSHKTYTWRQFFSHLATGKLIYPWVEVVSEVKDKSQ